MAGAVVLFERFVTAFATFNAENVADLFELPALALRKDGLLVSLPTRGDVVRYTKPRETATTGMAAGRADDGSVALRWRQSYCLITHGDQPTPEAVLLQKPFTPQELVTKVREVLDGAMMATG
jgi:hypothetical protein